MIFQQFLKAIAKGWKVILVITLLALAISLYISITTTPVYRSQATFIIAPNRNLASSRDIVSAFTALDTLKIFSTYTDILISDKVYAEAIKSGELADINLANYSRKTEMNPQSIILVLSVQGPDPKTAALLANEIGKYGIQFINAYYSVFEIDFLDQAVPPLVPFIPQTIRDAVIFAGIGFLLGLIIVVIREFSRTPVGFFIRRLMFDNESSSFSKRYLEKLLLNMKSKGNSWPITFILIKLKGLEDIFRILPGYSRKKIMTETVRRLKEQLKGNDLVGRWDELTIAVIMAKTPKNVVGMIENRLAQSLQSPISYGVEDEDQVDPAPMAVSTVIENDHDLDTFIAKSEKALHNKEW
jgi:capsular polysaccharide biosynthesis protein